MFVRLLLVVVAAVLSTESVAAEQTSLGTPPPPPAIGQFDLLASQADDEFVLPATALQEQAAAESSAGLSAISPQSAPPVRVQSNSLYNGDGRNGWSIGLGTAIVQPRWSSNPALYAVRGPVVPFVEERSFNWDPKAAALGWIGFTADEGLGIRGQWFGFSGNSSPESYFLDGVDVQGFTTPTVGGLSNGFGFPGDTLNAWSELKLQSIDLEFTKAFNYRRGQYVVSGGSRYAYIGQEYHSTLIDAFDVLQGSFDAGHNAAVIGPTAALQARYPSLAFPRLGLYGKARGGVLFGHANRSAAIDFGPVANYTASADVCVPVTEFEVGFDWNRPVGCGSIFVQTGLAAQTWYGVGNAAGSSTMSFVPVGVSVTDTSNMGLYGLKLAAGFNF
jgi:hypothetical protein